MSVVNGQGSNISQSEDFRRKIDAAKATLKEKYAVCKTAARRLSGAYARLVDAEAKLDLKPKSTRLMSKHAMHEAKYNAALQEYFSCAELYSSLVDDIIMLYNEYYLSESGRVAKKIIAESARFETQQYRVKQKIADVAKNVSEAIGAFDKQPKKKFPEQINREAEQTPDMPAASAPKPNEQEAHSFGAPGNAYSPHPPMDMYRPYMPHGVNIAPMSIDISEIVADAVSSAMEKFKAAFNKAAGAFVDSVPPASDASTDVDLTRANSLAQSVAEEEGVLVEKLSALMEKVQKLMDEMTELGAAYMQLANKQSDAADLQRRINDMQRAISREIQGVQAHQKVINQDQAAVTAEQTVIIEQQKANLEGHKLLIESSESVSSMQRTVIETQGAIEESMREMLGSQKDIIDSHQSLIDSTVKNAEPESEVDEIDVEEQPEVSDESVLGEIELEEQPEISDESVPEEIEVEEQPKVSEEIELDEIKVED